MATDIHSDIHTDISRTGELSANRMRKIALGAGVLYILTFVTSIPVLGMYDQALTSPDFIFGAGSDVSVQLGGLLEVLCALTGIGTAVVLYPVVRRVNRISGVGFVGSRVLEASMIFVGVLSMLTMVTLRGDAAGANAESLTTTWHALVGLHDATFLLGPGFMPAVNALFLATVMYKARLVPRIIPTIGLIGAPLLVISSTVTLFGGWDQVSAPALAFGLPIATWEFSLGVWMIVKGFKRPSVASVTTTPAPVVPEYAIA